MCEFSDVLIKSGEHDEAEKYLVQALDVMSAARGPDHAQNASIHKNLSLCYVALGRPEDAEYHKVRAEQLQEKARKSENQNLA